MEIGYKYVNAQGVLICKFICQQTYFYSIIVAREFCNYMTQLCLWLDYSHYFLWRYIYLFYENI